MKLPTYTVIYGAFAAMPIFLIWLYASWGIIDGVTTNPSLIAKEGVSLEKRIKEIAEIYNCSVGLVHKLITEK